MLREYWQRSGEFNCGMDIIQAITKWLESEGFQIVVKLDFIKYTHALLIYSSDSPPTNRPRPAFIRSIASLMLKGTTIKGFVGLDDDGYPITEEINQYDLNDPDSLPSLLKDLVRYGFKSTQGRSMGYKEPNQ